eukprot:TRINITY_DN4085_c0_g1_i1.p1 TRINITY_DN4085_c0_g1~~TRINITY_DN4085_c0_g1_i1.p1  ORF type:complete len:228 (+),score=48.34 TRINITY_DN4085_c0_g1_i1:254-937(+)
MGKGETALLILNDPRYEPNEYDWKNVVSWRSIPLISAFLNKGFRPTYSEFRNAISYRDSELIELFIPYMSESRLAKWMLMGEQSSSWLWALLTDPNIKLRFAPEILNDTIKLGYLDIVKLMLHHKDMTLEEGDLDRSALFSLVCEKGDLEMMNELMEDSRVDPSANFNSSIRMASKNGHSKVVSVLLKDPRVNPACWANSALRLAKQNGHQNVVDILLEDPRVEDMS